MGLCNWTLIWVFQRLLYLYYSSVQQTRRRCLPLRQLFETLRRVVIKTTGESPSQMWHTQRLGEIRTLVSVDFSLIMGFKQQVKVGDVVH